MIKYKLLAETDRAQYNNIRSEASGEAISTRRPRREANVPIKITETIRRVLYGE